MAKKETQWNRVFLLWGALLIFVIAFIAYPTEWKWGRWVYGLIWGLLTMVIIYLFRGFFGKPRDDKREERGYKKWQN